MSFKIEEILPFRIAYIRQVGPYGAGNVLTMERLKEWAASYSLLDHKSIILGIAHDNPETTKPECCRYDACIIVPDDYCTDEEYVNLGNILGGHYAVFTIDHTAEAVQKAWNEIFSELSKQGCQLDAARPILERYIVQMVNNHVCEICVPVR